MATKETPKKFYKSAATNHSSCRLCKAVVDKKHCRDLYKYSNRTILKNTEEIHGVLPFSARPEASSSNLSAKKA